MNIWYIRWRDEQEAVGGFRVSVTLQNVYMYIYIGIKYAAVRKAWPGIYRMRYIDIELLHIVRYL